MNTTVETINQLYDERGDLLDDRALCAICEHPFYLQDKLNDLNEQIRLVENIDEEAQADWFILFGVNLPQPVEFDHSPDGRRICSDCGCWAYEPHYQHCKHYTQPEPAQNNSTMYAMCPKCNPHAGRHYDSRFTNCVKCGAELIPPKSEPAQLIASTVNARTMYVADYDYHLQHGFTQAERTELNNLWNEKYKDGR